MIENINFHFPESMYKTKRFDVFYSYTKVLIKYYFMEYNLYFYFKLKQTY